MNNATNFSEYTVIKKYEGKYKLARIMLILGYILFPILGTLLILATPLNGFFIVFIAIFPLLLTIIVPLTYRYVQIEYEYRITGGTLFVAKIFGRRSRREWLSIPIGSMTAIAPYRDEYRAAADADDVDVRYNASSSLGHPDLYYAIYKDEDDRKCVLFFQPITKMLNLMRFHNRNTVVVKVGL